MYSSYAPQAILAGYLVLAMIGTPILRYSMIKRGSTGFVSWPEFWSTWLADAIGKSVLVGLLFWGGFWG